MSAATNPPPGPPDPAAIQHLFQLGTGYMVSAALGAVMHLDVPDLLKDGPRTSADLARAVKADEAALYRTMRALAMVGVFAETAPRTFALTPAGTLLRSDVPGSVRPLMHWLADSFHFRIYSELLTSVRTGETVGERVVGMPVFEYLASQPALSASFNDAMTSFSAHVAPAVLAVYDFSGVDVLVDVAGGHGMLLGAILQRYPAMRGMLLDLEHVLAGNRLAELGVKDRVQLQTVDFFKAVPPGGDAYIMKHIIHDWDDAKAIVILKHVRAALAGKPKGRLLLVESVVRAGDEPDLAKLIDLEMMLLPGGKERTEAEFAALFANAGFELTRVVPTESPLAIIEGRPRT